MKALVTETQKFSLPLSERYEYSKIFFGQKIQVPRISLINTKWKWFIYDKNSCFLRRIKYDINNEQFSFYYQNPFWEMLLYVLPRERTKLLSFSLEEGKKYMENDTRRPTDFRSFVIQISKQAISDTLPGHSVSVSESPTRPPCSGQPLSPARGGMPPRQGTTSLSKAPCFSSTVTGTARELLLLPAHARWRGWTCSGAH